MKNYKSAVGYGILMILIGMLPMVGDVIIGMVNRSLEAYFVPICYLMGGMLCVLADKKLLKLDTGSCFRKPQLLTLALIIIAGLGWSLADVFLANRQTFENNEFVPTFKEIYTMAATVFISPVAEELIFRLSVMTILLIAAGKSGLKKVLAILISCLPWVGIHFPRTAARLADLVIVGIVISLIYMFSKNIVYCLAFHISANIMTVLTVPVAKQLLANSYLMYVGIAIVIICLPAALVRLHRKGKCESFQPMSSLLTA
ncbi:MAG: CPBP family intramembrane metalloprotease [Ruminococcus sp.]|nr:CPBP family intramembrane metalloprotease [Ruminococcus sp.]